MNLLISNLQKKGTIDEHDIGNIRAKIETNTVDISDMIKSLEKLSKIAKSGGSGGSSNDMKYSELPSDMYKPIGDDIANDWKNAYSILNTDKWKVPHTPPPICISSGGPCKVCPTNSDNSTVYLQNWDASRKISNTKIN